MVDINDSERNENILDQNLIAEFIKTEDIEEKWERILIDERFMTLQVNQLW